MVRHSLVFAAAIFSLSFHSITFAEVVCADSPYHPGPLELAPSKPTECSWSKMQHEEYSACLKRKEFFGAMTESQKRDYNKEVRTRQKVVQVRRKRGRRAKVASAPYSASQSHPVNSTSH